MSHYVSDSCDAVRADTLSFLYDDYYAALEKSDFSPWERSKWLEKICNMYDYFFLPAHDEYIDIDMIPF